MLVHDALWNKKLSDLTIAELKGELTKRGQKRWARARTPPSSRTIHSYHEGEKPTELRIAPIWTDLTSTTKQLDQYIKQTRKEPDPDQQKTRKSTRRKKPRKREPQLRESPGGDPRPTKATRGFKNKRYHHRSGREPINSNPKTEKTRKSKIFGKLRRQKNNETPRTHRRMSITKGGTQ